MLTIFTLELLGNANWAQMANSFWWVLRMRRFFLIYNAMPPLVPSERRCSRREKPFTFGGRAPGDSQVSCRQNTSI